jgi:hypothetical protein
VSVQESVTVQVTGTAAQSATGLETSSASPSSQGTSTVTQFQIGCISECFGTTTTSASTATLAQQILSDFNSLQAACGSSATQPAPASFESVVDQVACQVQAAETAATQTQTASQSAAAVQVTDAAPPVAQTQQGTWQLQIGCIFYCVDTQQLQQAQQSITIINVQTGPSSSPGAVDVTDQVIWQLQVGCIAWCYDATQVQVVLGQSTEIVDESPPPPSPPPPAPAASPPPPTPAPDPAVPAQQTGPVAGQSTATASASPPVDGPPLRMAPPVRSVRLVTAVGVAGASMAVWNAPVGTVTRVRVSTAAVAPARSLNSPSASAHVSVGATAHLQFRQSGHSPARPHMDRSVAIARALAADPRVPDDVPVVALVLAAAAALLGLALVWTQTTAKSDR